MQFNQQHWQTKIFYGRLWSAEVQFSLQVSRPPDKSAYLKLIDISYFSTKTYVVGTQKNRLNETVLLSTQNICLDWWVRNNYNFYFMLKIFANLNKN